MPHKSRLIKPALVDNVVRVPLLRTEIVGWPLSDNKLARSLNNLLKAMKKLILWEILVHSLISQPSLLWGGHIWCSLKDRWEIIGRLMTSLNAPWAFIESSLRNHFRWQSLRDSFGLSQNFADTAVTVEITGQSLTDHWEILAITGRSLKDHWEIWPVFHCSMISQWYMW